ADVICMVCVCEAVSNGCHCKCIRMMLQIAKSSIIQTKHFELRSQIRMTSKPKVERPLCPEQCTPHHAPLELGHSQCLLNTLLSFCQKRRFHCKTRAAVSQSRIVPGFYYFIQIGYMFWGLCCT